MFAHSRTVDKNGILSTCGQNAQSMRPVYSGRAAPAAAQIFARRTVHPAAEGGGKAARVAEAAVQGDFGHAHFAPLQQREPLRDAVFLQILRERLAGHPLEKPAAALPGKPGDAGHLLQRQRLAIPLAQRAQQRVQPLQIRAGIRPAPAKLVLMAQKQRVDGVAEQALGLQLPGEGLPGLQLREAAAGLRLLLLQTDDRKAR